MDSFSISLAGRWRAALDADGEGAAHLAETALRDHIELRLGDRSLTAHLGDDEVLPFLVALAESLAPTAPAGPVVCPLFPSAHRLAVDRRGREVHLSLVATDGRLIIREAIVDANAMRDAVGTVGGEVMRGLAELAPTWGRRALVRRLRRALARLALVQGERGPSAEGPHPATTGNLVRKRERRAPVKPARFPLEVSEAGVRLGASWATMDGSGGRRAFFGRLMDAALQLARAPDRRVGVPWCSTPRTTLHIERRPDGAVDWSLRDALAPWMTGTVPFSVFVSTLARCGRLVREIDPDDLRRRLREIRAWARAAALPPLLGGPVPPGDRVLPAMTSGDVVALPHEPAVRRLFHVAFRRAWRRPLRRFLLPPQRLAGPSILLHLPDATVGLSLANGRERWRRLGTHPALVGGPCGLVLDRRGHLSQLDAGTGETVWIQPRPWRNAPVTSLASDSDGLVLATETGSVIGLDPQGRPVFRTRLAAGSAVGLTLSRSLAWVSGEDRHLYAFGRADGVLHARVPVVGHLVGPPQWRAEGLLVTSDEGPRARVSVHDPASGALRRSVAMPGVFQSLRLLSEPDFVAVVTTLDETTTFSVADLRRGEIAFCLPAVAGRGTLTTHQGLILCGATGGRLAAFDARDGAPVWRVDLTDATDGLAPPVHPLGVGGLVYAVGAALVTIDPAGGRLLSRFALDDIDLGSWLITDRGDVLLADTDRALILLERSGHLAKVD